MKRIVILICTLAIFFHMHAQQPASPVGEYFLKGEMEMAAGLKLDSNGQFQFFFSYGALDRQAKGLWRLDGEHLLLTSEPKETKDFELTQSKQSPAKNVTIFLSGVPSEIWRYFTATGITKNKKQVNGTADAKGRIVLPVDHVDSLILQFDWCPEKAFHYNVGSSLHNQFSFRVLPSITDVVFDNNGFTITPEEITGTLPFSGDHVCTFRRTTSDDHEP